MRSEITKPKVYMTLVLDSTGSMAGAPIESALEGGQEIAKILMSQCSDPGLKLGHFNSGLPQIPKFLVSKEVSEIDWKRVQGQVRCGYQTPLYDTIVNTISTMEYGRKYKGIHRLCVILTDGEDNASSSTWQDARDKIADPGPINRNGNFHFLLFGAGIRRFRESELKLLCSGVTHATYHRVEDAKKIKEVLFSEVSKQIRIIVEHTTRLAVTIDGDECKLDDVPLELLTAANDDHIHKQSPSQGRERGSRGRGRGGRRRGGRDRGGRDRGGRGRGSAGRGRKPC